MKMRVLAAFFAAVLVLGSAWGDNVVDDTWGEAWNSKIGLANMKTDSNQDWNGHAADKERGSATMLFNNICAKNSEDFLHTMSKGKPWIKLVITNTFEEGKDIVLKKYRIISGNTVGELDRSPKTWSIYGSEDVNAQWGDDSLLPIDSRVGGAKVMSADYDCSANAAPYRVYFFYFEENNGGTLLQIPELYLFGEIKEHVKQILYIVSTPYDGLYDGYPHGITVTPTKPESGVTVEYSADGTMWQATSPTFSEVGSHKIYYRLTAEGYPTVNNYATIEIREPPQENLDVTATIRAAESADGKTHHAVATGGTSGSAFGTGVPAAFVDGENTARLGWRYSGSTLTYEILDTYRPDDEVTVTGLTFTVGTGVDKGANDVLRDWRFEAWDAMTEEWVTLVRKESGEWPAWSADEIDSSLGAYVRNCYFENTLVSRKYRFTTYSRSFLSDLRLLGNIMMPAGDTILVSALDCEGTYDGTQQGITLKVTRPKSGYYIRYSLDGKDWTKQPLTTEGPVTTPCPVYWRVTAQGYPAKYGTNTIHIADQPHEDLDITAAIRAAGKGFYGAEMSANGAFYADSPYNFVDGEVTDRNGWRTSGGSCYFYLTISNDFRTAEDIVVKGVAFAGQTNQVIYSRSVCLPTDWSIAGSDDGETWQTIAEYDAESYPAWGDADLTKDVYYRRTDFANTASYRQYRLYFKGDRVHISELYLYGDVGEQRTDKLPVQPPKAGTVLMLR